MVRITSKETLVEDVDVVEIYGSSLDTKPTSTRFANGSIFIEIDTSKAYFYDEENQEWLEAGGSNG